MATIDSITLEVTEVAAAERFYAAAFDVGDLLRLRASDSPTSGFRGFTLSLVVPQPSGVDALVARARDAGAIVLQEPTKSLWGYGGSVQAPDGTVWTVASSSKKETGPPSEGVDDVVLQLGVHDVVPSTQFYVDHGFTVRKSFGHTYAELDAGPVTVTLNKRKAVAKAAGVPPDGTGSHRLAVTSDAGSFTDPDGYVWESR
ncbi:glyoxalase [uncultured Georgenia sp.]|uniref:glyoxalase n=1 Tax=uncultured Georgenia sp. TaxID=378209 RepID=UPI0026025DC9|nr:glyoxalase [uncultured Georgenia sp.]